MVEVNPIRSEREYDAALEEIEALMQARAGTPEGDRLDVLVALVQAYEAEHHRIDAPDPIALLQFVMEQKGIGRAALQPMIGSRGRVSEIMTRKRALTLPMIRKLQAGLGLPADVLVRPYRIRRSKAA
jgi:HTH-type transcriptional regulator/antitoxin HigA